MHDFSAALIAAMKQAAVLVVGDAMLDLYTDGSSTRQSPEAPVPVIAAAKTQMMPGGAANLAANVAALAGKTYLIAVTGEDGARETMMAHARHAGIDPSGLLIDPSRPTTTKHRYLANGKHVVRVDHEETHAIDGNIKKSVMAQINQCLPQVQAVILSDYRKGMLPDDVVRHIIDTARKQSVPVLVDSKRTDWRVFEGAALGKPNQAELSALSSTEKDLEKAARQLMKQSGVAALAASMADQGVMLITADRTHHYPATARKVAEVSGAGDTLLAGIATALAAGATLPEAVQIGNVAAGLAVERKGTSIITYKELNDFLISSTQARQSA